MKASTNTLLATVALLCGTTPLLAQGADECANADDLGTGSVAVLVDTTNCSDTGTLATSSAENNCFSLTNDVWFKWTAARSGMVQFSTCVTSFDSELSIWEGSDCGTMTHLGCNDDNNLQGCAGVSSGILVPVVAGMEYKIQCGYWSGSGCCHGITTLFIDDAAGPTMGADACVAADDIGAGDVSVPFSTDIASDTLAPATNSGTASNSCGSIGNDVWFRWTATRTGAVTFSTCNAATFDTQIDIYTGTNCGNLTFQACNDDFTGCAGNSSEVTVSAVEGVCYYIVVGEWISSGTATGTGTLTVTQNPLPNLPGTNACWSNANSTGAVAHISAVGSEVASDDDLLLLCSKVPAQQNGYFIGSPNLAGFPIAIGGSQGNLCLSSDFSRFTALAGAASGAGILTANVGTLNYPSNPVVNVLPGETWYYIAWFRDNNPDPTSNFSNALCITFQ